MKLETSKKIFQNLNSQELIKEALARKEGVLTKSGALSVNTGKHTGRSPFDRFYVDTPSVKDQINISKANQLISEDVYKKLYAKAEKYIKDKDIFVRDGFVGSNKKTQLKIRVINEFAWQNLFCKNIFIRPESDEELKDFAPQFTVIALPNLKADPTTDGTPTETAILVNLDEKVVLVIGTAYAGEIKKSMFTVMNYLLPEKNIFPMHCSCNVGDKEDSALFFGLSGTGKTTLSADPSRNLVGDDEHGWDEDGIFNFEGGCYAKMIDLEEKNEPQIYKASLKEGSVLENVVLTADGNVDFFDKSLTENTRGCYPLEYIGNAKADKKTVHPKNIIMLTCDAFGVLPPISKLNTSQALYHFISGYTAKVAGTEMGLKEPQATFSTCFGAPFMPRHPNVYAQLLKKNMEQHNTDCWLVNTGWIKGEYGVGERISLKYTRALLTAVLDGKLKDVKYQTDDIFGFQIPTSCEGVPAEILNPINLWEDKQSFEDKYKNLAKLFVDNFKKFEDGCSKDIIEASPKI
ncbi:MAG: phosphoenolpyruvate carboxykinase (ATP) [Elusimicrobiaceae bacterium]|jgi:phosphoenolpyruvate carboxykinase (ATP)|nr:phosphoenolpyruvate carboxykinase (ATP) [Elusimicrobiaceae bacterium]MBT3955059.1 phosphoenolpyruvate carboxykinase (ATP) [Elusimicrobiaceae bacterium]MBT4402845.1 phosphoenolpyruvate carboxykinase (ATP) [Elusimicrobiaceae bacterium]MBT4440258.1 phosphoenolpyruvate carboxykinase (ATP) [Elusimicrobiaceae bacterium]MBT5987261.1 phosphoenolpyruvate carboxykinase (ATP) [Elusimicrobiaceae bacterium]